MLVKKNKDTATGLAEQIERLLDDPSFDPETLDNKTRHRLSEAARKLSIATETRGATYHRMAHAPFQLPLVIVGIETGVFDVLVELDGKTVSTAQLSERTGIEKSLMKRFLRYYQSYGIVAQTDDEAYLANNITRALTSFGGRSALPFIFETAVPVFNALPQYLRENPSADLKTQPHIPFYMGHKSDEPLFKFVNSRPTVLKNFMGWMAAQRDSAGIFFDAVDFEKEFCQNADAETPVFVDIGGSLGHQCVAVKQKYPGLKGRVILEDLEEIVVKVKANPLPGFEGVEMVVHDMFTPQPVKGARAYYMRNVLHDWGDDQCVDILKNIKVSMTAESRILIDEVILADKDVPWRTAQQDLIMATCIAAKERTHAEWLELFDEAGLKVERMWKYTDEFSDYLMALVPK